MGSTLGNLQILGAAEEAVRAALPEAIVGSWSGRFVTACPDELFFDPLEKEAKRLSCRQLPGDILTFAPAREDGLCLAVHQQNKYRTRVYHAF